MPVCVTNKSIILQVLQATLSASQSSRINKVLSRRIKNTHAMHCVRQSIKLLDGRNLSYAVFGTLLQPTACPVVYHHGWPSSAAEGAVWSEAAAAAAHGLCLIAVDRPGIGGPTYNPTGSFASYADDISQLLHQLNMQSATHIGTSGGGPYACACAAMNPKTTAALGLVASMTHCSGPGSRQLLHGLHWFERIGYNMIAYSSQLVALGLGLGAQCVAAAAAVAKVLCTMQGGESWSSSSSGSSSLPLGSGVPGTRSTAPAGAVQEEQQQQQQQQGLMSMLVGFASRTTLRLLGAFMHPADRQMLQQHSAVFTQLLPSMLADSFAQGSKGLFHDMRLTTQPWKIDLKQITAPTLVFLGEQDVNVTVAQARCLAGQIQGAQLRLFPEETHFSLVGKHAHKILGMVTTDLIRRS